MAVSTAARGVVTKEDQSSSKVIATAEAACEEAVRLFERFAHDTLEWEGRSFQRFTSGEIEYGCKLMCHYFLGSQGFKTMPGSARVTSAIRFGFALTCRKYDLKNLRMQASPWYAKFAERVRKFLAQKAKAKHTRP